MASSPCIRHDHVFRSAFPFLFSHIIPCDQKSAGILKPVGPGPHVRRVLHFADDKSEDEAGKVAGSKLIQLFDAEAGAEAF